MNLYRSLTRSAPLSVDEWASFFQFGGIGYGPLLGAQTLTGDSETIEPTFDGYVRGAYKANGVVFACMLARLLLFSEARMSFRRLRNGRPGDLFGTPALRLCERPWPGATTGDLLARAIQDADLAGNFYAARRAGKSGPRLKRLRPDWVTIILGSDSVPEGEDVVGDVDAEVVGYVYQAGGARSSRRPVVLLPEQVCHFAPIPDPLAAFRGMSWLDPVIREVMGDSAATVHKHKFFDNGATPNMVVTLDAAAAPTPEKFNEWVDAFEDRHEGLLNAYRTLYLGAGSNAQVVGAHMRQIAFKETQGAGETRIAAAAGVPPVIVGLSEGLQAATYSNYSQARRRFADGTIRPLWRNFAGSLAPLVDVPADGELWYDDRDISFLQEDRKDAAEIAAQESQTIKTLTDAGFTPESAIAAVNNANWALLEHTGLFSVQLQPPGTTTPPPPAA